MKTTPLHIPGVILIEPTVYGDHRGFFFESFNEAHFSTTVGHLVHFVQDNHSHSLRNVLRGLHYQVQQPQGKLVRVVHGEIFDVAVDIRPQSPTFGQWVGETLNADDKKQMWIPEGFAHGFLTLSESAEILYKTTHYYAPQHERIIAWDDPKLNITWPLHGAAPILSEKDKSASRWG